MKRRAGHIAVLLVAAVLAALGLAWLERTPLLPRAHAQAVDNANFMNPFPENDVWRGLVIGDYLAEGLLGGLSEAMASETRLQLQRRHRAFAGLGRVDIEDDARSLDEMVGKEKFGIAVIMLGMADRGGIRLPNGRRLAVGQGDWRVQYAARVDRLVRSLRRRGVAVYWVGLPIMRRSDWNEDVETINEVIRERVMNAGGRYIDAFKESADENGQFSDRGPDISGRVVRLRDPEGYDFTPAGYRKLAFFIERQMKRDMSTAREERTIPLAGAESEQRRINPAAASQAAGPPDPGAAKGTATGKDARGGIAGSAKGPAVGVTTDAGSYAGGDLKADNVRVSFRSSTDGKDEQVTIEIVRPPLYQSVIQLMTRRDRGDRPSQIGDTMTDTLSNGLLVMRSVTPSRAGGERGASRGTLTQQPFFIALAKGERLPSKPGRADDFRWPREDDIPLPPQPAQAAAPMTSPVPLSKSGAAKQQQRAPLRPRPQRTETGSGPSAGSIFQQ